VPRNGARTRERLLEAAEQLVIENGFAATSVDAVIAASGTSKGAYFHHFDSKFALARALVDRYVAADLAHLETALAASEAASPDPARRVIAFLRFFEDGAEELMSAQSSCLYVAMLAERQLAGSTTPQITDAVLAWRTAFSRMLEAAFAVLPTPVAVDPGDLADHLFVTFEGSFLLCRSTGNAQHMRTQLTVLRQLVEHLLDVGSVQAPAEHGPGHQSRRTSSLPADR
jgi:TetR/AcrR family transcriptional regulator, transcriptional repressor for nem operon